MTTRKQRHHLYLPDDLSAALDTLGRDPRTSKSTIVADALRSWLERRAGHALDERFAIRLDRLGRGQERVEQRLAYVAEALGTFVQHQLTLVAHQPPFTLETAHLGRQRYRAFVDAVGRRLTHDAAEDALRSDAGPGPAGKE